MNLIKYLSLSVFCASMVGCASFDANTHQKYNFVSENVPAVKVVIDGSVAGATPVSYVAERGKSFAAEFTKEGYESYTRKITPSKNPQSPATIDYKLEDLKPIPGYKAPEPVAEPETVAEPVKEVAPEPVAAPEPAPVPEVKAEPVKVAEPVKEVAPVKKAEPKKVLPCRTLTELQADLKKLKKQRQLNIISQEVFDAKAQKIADEIAALYK